MFSLTKTKIKNNDILKNTLIIFSFFILSIISVSIIYSCGKLYLLRDGVFYISRLYEIIKSQSLIPRFALNSFSYIGSAVMAMYPNLFLYVSAFIYFLVKSMRLTLLIAFVFWIFVTCLICFYSSLKLSENKFISYLFSLTYTFSSSFVSMYFYAPDLGVFYANIVLPLVIFGSIYCLKDHKWVMFSIGMSLVLYSSIITFAFLLFLLIIWFGMNYKLINRSEIYSICKASVTTILSTTLVWLPVLKILLNNKLSSIAFGNIFPIGNLYDIMINSLRNTSAGGTITQALNIYSLLGVLIGAIFYKKIPKLLQRLYLFSILIIILCSSIFPWQIFNGKSSFCKAIQLLQFSCRLLVIPQVILSFVLSFCLIKHIYFCRAFTKKLILFIFIIFVILLQLSNQAFYSSKEFAITTNMTGVMTTRNFHNIKHYMLNVPLLDYWPAVSESNKNELFNQDGESQNHKIIHFMPKGNGKFIFKTSKINHGTISLPFLYYHDIKYRCNLDHKLSKIHSNKKQLATIDHISPGVHHIHIYIPLDFVSYISIYLSILGFIIYLVILLRKYIL